MVFGMPPLNPDPSPRQQQILELIEQFLLQLYAEPDGAADERRGVVQGRHGVSRPAGFASRRVPAATGVR